MQMGRGYSAPMVMEQSVVSMEPMMVEGEHMGRLHKGQMEVCHSQSAAAMKEVPKGLKSQKSGRPDETCFA